nr:protein trichome birefringence-like 42 [Ipomoea trifida]
MPPLYSLPAQENARFLNVAGNGYGNANAFPQNHEKCDIFEGKWVYKPMESPLYEVSKCPFLSDQVSCQRNGRPDSEYEKWSWEASGCVVPSFNATDMLERLRGKRVIIVGDSLNRNQWESLACLLYSAIPSSRAIVSVQSGSYKVFKAKDYNVSVEFYWSPFLVQLDSNQAGSPKVLRLDKLDPSSKRWKGAEIMVFNTGHWWTHRGKLKAWDLFQYEEKLTDEMGIESAFKLAMQTWGKWIDDNIDPTKTTIFFRSISPEHHGQHWCYNETKPIIDVSDMTVFPEPLRKIVERTVSNLKTRVRYLNITKLSQYRKDAHPTVYARKNGKQMIEKKLNPKETYSDCSHWCLPGLPDTWNRLLYASMVLDGSTCGPNSKHFISHSTSSIVNSSNA